MANNRVYLYCPVCDEAMRFAKHDGGARWYDPRTAEQLEAWWEKHAGCYTVSSTMELRYDEHEDPTKVITDKTTRFESNPRFPVPAQEPPG